MSHGPDACIADVIREDFVAKTCPKEFGEFITEIDTAKLDFAFVASMIRFTPIEEVPKPVVAAYKKLRRAFKKVTGLGLYLSHADEEAVGGQDADAVSGAYWCVDGVKQATEAGRKYRRQIRRCRWVENEI